MSQVYCPACDSALSPKLLKEQRDAAVKERDERIRYLEEEAGDCPHQMERDALRAEVARLKSEKDAAVKEERERCAKIVKEKQIHWCVDDNGPDTLIYACGCSHRDTKREAEEFEHDAECLATDIRSGEVRP